MFHIIYKFKCRLRAYLFNFTFRKKFRRIGRDFKFFGSKFFSIGKEVAVGDNCWFEAVYNYRGTVYSPHIEIGSKTSFSDRVHLSSIGYIHIGEGVLFGSNIYVGDHSHGSSNLNKDTMLIVPAERNLDDYRPIFIGDNVWIGDGAVILAGSYIPDGSIIASNSVVKTKFPLPGIFAGIPAEIKREFYNE